MVLVANRKPIQEDQPMRKSSNVKSIRVNEEISKQAPSIDFDLKNINLQEVIRMGLQDFMFEVGMIAVQQSMAAEVGTLAGPRYVREPENDARRWGTQQGFVYVNGQKVNIDKPRVVRKSAGKHKEVELETYKEFSKPTAMNEAIMAKVLAGVSTRDYAGTIEEVLDGHGVSRSAVSRRAVKESSKRLEQFYTRRFDDQEFVVLMIDGIGISDVDNIVALGIDIWGKKHVLGMRQGATENTVVCAELLQDLIERGLSADGDYLFVIDGAKALSKAIKKVFGTGAVIQRCQVHKRRNVSDKLPKEHQTRIDKRLAAAYAMNDLNDARKSVEAVFDELVDLNEPAAGSLAEGMEETLTVHKLGLKGDLKRILSSTNCIESMFSMSRRYKRNVKKWNRKTNHIERTLVATLLEAEKRFRRVRGYRELKDLQSKIKNLRATTCNTKAA
jgi:putative transposase